MLPRRACQKVSDSLKHLSFAAYHINIGSAKKCCLVSDFQVEQMYTLIYRTCNEGRKHWYENLNRMHFLALGPCFICILSSH